MGQSIHFLNGKFVSEDELLISPRDLGFTRGYAVFDFLRTYNKRPFKLKEHIDRLFNSLKLMDLKVPWSKDQISQWILDTLDQNDSKSEKFIKIIISGGISNSLLPENKPTIVILVDLAVVYPEKNYTQGVKAVAVNFKRDTPNAKSNNYIQAVRQIQKFNVKDIFEPIYYNEKQVFEGSNSNVFAVVNGELLTPKTDILIGITRTVLLDILKLDCPVKVKDFTLPDLLVASEVFLSASGKGVTPIVEIDGQKIGTGQVGPITQEVMRQYKEYTLLN
jgi:branched-chain amino acid aminotransferase